MNNHNIVANNRVFNPLNSICVVTGGSSGIGFSLIKELKKRKAKKIINIDIVECNQSEVDFYKCDVGDNDMIRKVLDEIYFKYKEIDLICSNAGIAKDDDGLATVDHWNKIWATNVLQHTNLVRNSITKMIEKKKWLVFNNCFSSGSFISGRLCYLLYNKACSSRFCRMVVYNVWEL